ncbi:ComEC/Rec2 family competence protein [Sphingomonas sp. BK580]|uniref:ComEC/Rec2 family competence protein n=1 Tax=Sphingomonas sp. BK580 TaxID=2586972 RepID=UPI001852908D|nr:ComEC/Rec2 family competence protein [Sphingomonas sp. BK580]MBB3692754.1 competence protein ComEC [Sphingomonas sp. BK580]
MERWLEAERDQLFLWLPVALGAGAALWFVLPERREWVALILVALGIASSAAASWRGGRAAPFAAMLGLAVATGTTLAWTRARRVATPALDRPAVVRFAGTVEKVEPLPARGLVRVTLGTLHWERSPHRAPLRLRVSLPQRAVPATLGTGAAMTVRARLMPPASPAVPGAYDAARAAWFDGVGASGRGYTPVALRGVGAPGVRDRLTAHITAALAGSAGGIAAALVTGDMGAIAEGDSLAMRRAGLAHLLSVSGLHITATVGIVMAAVLRLLALSRRLALTGLLPLVAAGAGAVAAIGYTWLTGSQVPTIRSCVAALMVLAALALGREALTLRLVAMGALVVLLAWPEAVVGPSFQLSFAAVAAIVALHEHPRVRAALLARDEPWPRKWLREAASLLVTGAVVELALMPIAVFYFHQAGAYGAIANIVAIPLTTFAIMPAVAVALLLDALGWGAPAWWVAGRAIASLLWIAHTVAALPGAVRAIPAMPLGAFATMVAGGIWLTLWRTRWRYLGLAPIAIGAAWTLATPAPDLLVTGDGRHLAVRQADGGLALLRDRAGGYVRDALAQNGGIDGVPGLLSESNEARCNRDLCWWQRRVAGRWRRVLATRSGYTVPAARLTRLCNAADVVVSERRLPRRCRARWLTLDRTALARTGGVAITFANERVVAVRSERDEHPWVTAEGTSPQAPARVGVRPHERCRARAWAPPCAGERRDPPSAR